MDVEDLAAAHVAALDVKEAGNKRFVVSAGDFDNQEIVDILRAKLPPQWAKKVPRGTPGAREAGKHFTTDSSLAIEILRVKFKSLEESVLGLVTQLIKLQEDAIVHSSLA